MFRLLLLLLLAIVIGVMALVAVAFKLWGLPGFLGVMVGILASLWLLKRLAGLALKTLISAPFKAKGAVLTSALVNVHSVTAADQPARRYDPSEDNEDDAAPDEDGEEPAPEAPLRWYRIDATITPTAKTGAFQMWEPGELQLAPPSEAEVDPESGYSLEDLRIWQNGSFQEDDGGKYEGEQRIEFLVGVPEGMDRLRFVYYFEQFGEMRLTAA